MLAALLIGLNAVRPAVDELLVSIVPAQPVDLLALDEVWVDAVTDGPAIVLQLDNFKDTYFDFPLLSWPSTLTSGAGHALTIDQVSMTLVTGGRDDVTLSPPATPNKGAKANDGYLEVRFGYRLVASAAQPPGVYSGTFDIEVESTQHDTGVVPAQVTVSVEVMAPISITVHDFDAGVIAPGQFVGVLPWHPEAGRIEVTGQPGAQVQVVYTQVPAAIYNATGASISTNFSAIEWNVETGSCESEVTQLVSQGGQTTGTLPATPGVPWILCVGGSINPPQLTEPGVYSGVLSVDVQYPGSIP